MIDLVGAIDLHVHSAPCLFPRIGDDLTVARAAQAAGLRGLVLKSHHESTVGRAAVVNAVLGGSFIAYGSLTLNHSVGGVNPSAVEAALHTGARLIWMPTIDSMAHTAVYGHTGGWDVQNARHQRTDQARPPLTILDKGRLSGEALAVLELCHQHGVALGTGHLGGAEILALARRATEIGFDGLIITHPIFKVPALDGAALRELLGHSVWFEFTYCTVSPMWRAATIEQTLDAIRLVGASRCFLSSDGGQTHHPMPHECLRMLAQMLLERGLEEDAIYRMIREVPALLIESTPLRTIA